MLLSRQEGHAMTDFLSLAMALVAILYTVLIIVMIDGQFSPMASVSWQKVRLVLVSLCHVTTLCSGALLAMIVAGSVTTATVVYLPACLVDWYYYLVGFAIFSAVLILIEATFLRAAGNYEFGNGLEIAFKT